MFSYCPWVPGLFLGLPHPRRLPHLLALLTDVQIGLVYVSGFTRLYGPEGGVHTVTHRV